MAECSQKSTPDLFVASSKVYVRDPDTSMHGCENKTDPKEEDEYAVAVQESDPTVPLRKDRSEMAALKH